MATRGRPTKPRAERRAEAREALLRAVTNLLADGPAYADLSINAIVAEAGLAKSTFYQYFTGKNELLSSLIEQAVAGAGPAIAWLDRERPATPEHLARSLQGKVATQRRYLPLIAAAFDAAYFDRQVRECVDQLMTLLNDATETHVRFGQAGGWIDPALPPREIAIWLNWMFSRGLHKLALTADEDRLDELLVSFSRVVWPVLYAFPGPRQRGGRRARSATS
jgi:AcrR family transcriptional regulator